MKCNECKILFNKHTQQGGYVENKWYCNLHINNQPERLSEKTYYRNEDGTYPPLEPVIGSDSLIS